MRLQKQQREAVLAWLAEGLKSDEINQRAAAFESPFEVSRENAYQYRLRYGVQIKALSQAADLAALHEGLSVKAARVHRLQKMADEMTLDLFDRGLFWTTLVKGIGGDKNFERIEYQEFNKAEVEELRGVLDDIAQEMGERSSKDIQAQVTLNVEGFDQVIEKVYGQAAAKSKKPASPRDPLKQSEPRRPRPARKPAKRSTTKHMPPPSGEPKMTAEEWNRAMEMPGDAEREKKRRNEYRQY